MNRLVLGGGVISSVVSLILFFGITVVECSSQGTVSVQGVCIVTHPIWPLAILPIGLVLVGLSFFLGLHKSAETQNTVREPRVNSEKKSGNEPKIYRSLVVLTLFSKEH